MNIKTYKRIILENKIVLIFNFLTLCFLCGTALQEYKSESIGISGYILEILTNHYYILYCMVPALFIIMARYIKGIRYIEIIRYKSYYNQIRNSTKIFAIWLILYLSINIIIAFIVGIKIFGFTEYHIFNSSLFPIIFCTSYFIFGFSVLFSLLSYINYRYGHKKVILVSIIVYALTFIGFKTELKTIIPFICFNNFIVLHHGLLVNGIKKFIAVILVGFLILLFCFGKRIKIQSSTFKEFIFSNKEKRIAIGIVLLVFILDVFRSLNGPGFNLRNVIISTLIGTGEEYTSFISWLKLTILYMTPLFFIATVDKRMKKYGQAPILIRMESRMKFEYIIRKEYLKFILFYVFSIFVYTNVFYYLGGLNTGYEDYLMYLYGINFTNGILNLYIMIYLIYTIVDFILFTIITKYCDSLVAFVLILFCKFILFLIPSINYLNFNFGMINLFKYIINV